MSLFPYSGLVFKFCEVSFASIKELPHDSPYHLMYLEVCKIHVSGFDSIAVAGLVLMVLLLWLSTA